MNREYESRTQYQPYKFDVGLKVVFTFQGRGLVGVIRERHVDHNGENIYKIRVQAALTRTVMERNIKDAARDPRSVAAGPTHGEILPPPPPGEIHVRSDDVMPNPFRNVEGHSTWG